MKKTPYNKVLPKARVTCFDNTFVLNQTLFFQINSIAEKPRLRQYPNRYHQFKRTTMTPIRKYWILFLVLISFSCNNVKEVVTPYAPTSKEVYPNDTILQAIIDKKAMIVIAHDDDMCAMAGTISKLNNEGWEIEIVSFH